MKNVDILTELLHQKMERQAVLSNKISNLNKASNNLTGSKISRWFGSSYLLVKRIVTLLIGISLLFMALYFMAYPENVLNKAQTKEMVEDAKNDYSKIIGETIGETIVELFKSNQKITAAQVNREFSKAFEHMLQQEIYAAIQFLAFLLIPLALFSLYVSRLTKKMRQRNHKISAAQSLTQEVISNYSQDQVYLKQEIEILKNILQQESQSNPTL